MQSGVTLTTKEEELKIKYGPGVYDCEFNHVSKEYALTSVKYILTDLNDIRRRYISLGFHLSEFRKNNYYLCFGYVRFEDFCEANFGLDKSAVSRCINVYRTFNASNSISYENGVKKIGAAIDLSEKWKDYSYSQLCEMVSMDEEQRSQVKPDMTIKQIREIKKQNVSQVATSQPEKFDFDKYSNKNGIVLQNYIKNLVPQKQSVPVYIFDRDGKKLSLGKVVNVLEFGSDGLFIRLQYNDEDIAKAIENLKE